MNTQRAGSPPPFGFNVISFASGNFGLAVAARNTVRMLTERGFPVRIVDIDAGGGRSGHHHEFAHLESPGAVEAPYAVNLFHMNPPDVVNVLRDKPRWLDLRSRLNVCVPFWELPKLPVQDFVPVLSSMDLVLCPTRFILETVRTSAPAARCAHYPQAAFVPDDVRPDRAAFGLDADKTLFMVAFDLGSDIDRKNPWAAIEAFRMAFPSRPDVGLVIKVNNPMLNRELARSAERLREIAKVAPGITLVDRALSYPEVLSLYASCDVMVSLHRSEGLGLHLIEAMQLGKPVIATGWSGNLDFMTAEDSCLVDYRLVPAVSDHPSYAPGIIGDGQVWAEPDVGQSAEWMRRLADDAGLRDRLGERARADSFAQRDAFLDGAPIDDLASRWERRAVEFPDHESRASALLRTRRVSLYRRARRLAAKTLRAIGLRK